MKEAVVSVFDSIYHSGKPKNATLETILSRIQQGGDKKNDLVQMRSATDAQRKAIKQGLPLITFGGTFNNRSKSGLIDGSGLAVLDFDHVENLEELKKEVSSKPYIVSAFISPSGDGLKAIARIPQVDSDEEFKSYYYGLMEQFDGVDESTKDICRACFFSYDPDIYVNYDATEFTDFKRQDPSKKKHGRNALDTALSMIRYAEDGEKHHVLLKASRLCGGFIASNILDEDEAKAALLAEISKRNIDSVQAAKTTIEKGIENGKLEPLNRAMEILEEQRFIRRDDGSYDFIADEDEMNEYLEKYIEGKIEFGLPTFMGDLDDHFRFKENNLLIVAGLDNVGKSFLLWYLRVVAAMYHGHKTLIFSAENKDAMLKRKILEFYMGKKITEASRDEIKVANEFYKEHFRIISSQRSIYSAKDILDIATEMYLREWGAYDCLVVEPYNALEVRSQNEYRYHYDTLAKMRLFASNYCSVTMAAHVHSNAARRKDSQGYIEVPIKSDIEGGQQFANRTDDFMMYHRLTNHPTDWNIGQLHVQKIKDTETGGKVTTKDEPVRIKANPDLCGFKVVDAHGIREVDAVANWWKAKGIKDPLRETYGDSENLGELPF